MKKLIVNVLLIAGISFFASAAHAVQCGAGKIIDLKEGGWNDNGLALLLEGPNSNLGNNTKRAGTGGTRYVFFSAANLPTDQLEAIRRIASLAFAADKTVWTNSHSGSCSNATELSVLANP